MLVSEPLFCELAPILPNLPATKHQQTLATLVAFLLRRFFLLPPCGNDDLPVKIRYTTTKLQLRLTHIAKMATKSIHVVVSIVFSSHMSNA
ncbi:hypothetical protein DU506_01800 [Vreelandella rituensis]|uniref:Uncharacterized protein n=1 Tax=Vreelandella rituensis TaxID=2282306 RepID=A0A368UAW2_9GAMM|nr:hypothetical protein DU506_01800 [Halomonas rituensis]